MKNFTFLLAAFLFVTCISAQSQRGTNNTTPTTKGINPPPQRCGTDEMIQQRLQTDPIFRAHYEEGLRQYEESMHTQAGRTAWTTTLTSPVTIPIVVHIVLPDPTVVTDADVLYFVKRMSLDYSGFNPDSTNGVPFYSVRGHSLIRWTLAKTDPSGNFTTGIERRVGAGAIQGGNPQPIKNFAQGGLDAWDVTKYMNIWVGVGTGGLLGIAPEIGPGGPAGSTNTDGPCVDYRAFSRNPGYTYAAFCLARTAVHEIGHNMGLYHPFQNGCGATNDFGQLTSTTSGCPSGLPSSLLDPADDTPAQSNSTSGCPSGTAASGCAQSPNPPGRMYQCYMDYTDDPCYSMFSVGEVNRMHYVLENCRSGWLTTTGGNFPASAPNRDIAVTSVVRPGGSEFIGTGRYSDPTNGGCGSFTIANYPNPSCGGVISPRIRIQNRGKDTLKTITVNSSLNGTPNTPQTINLSGWGLAYLEDTVIGLNNITLVGNNTLKFWVANPNGSSDQNNANDTLTKILNFSGSPLPLVNDFQSGFPGTGWSIINPNNDLTWVASPGNQSTVSAGKDNYTDPFTGRIDDIRSPVITTTGLDSLIISWDLAHKNYPGFNDRFDVVVSTDCGNTFTTVFTQTDPALATAGSSTANYTNPAAADWVRKRISIGNNVPGWSTGQMIVAFRNVNGYGNWLYVDNINISGFAFTPRDLAPQTVITPKTFECTSSITPSITVKNTGTGNITTYKVGYQLDNNPQVIPATLYGPIAAGATQTITFAAPIVVTPGAHKIKLFTNSPDGLADLNPVNDTIIKSFTVRQLFNTVSEDFETPTFPPPTVTIVNPNGNNTWVKSVPGHNSATAARIDNYTNPNTGQTDDIQLRAINTAGVDSIILTFEVAHKNYPGFADALAVVASTDCGNTFLPTSYNKVDPALATAGASTAAYTVAGNNDWRTERVALGGSFLTSGSLILAIRDINGYGNWIHIDNINIIKKYKRDIQVVSIDVPKSVLCSATSTPSVTLRNVGSDSITSVVVNYRINSGAVVSTPTITFSPKLAPNATTVQTLPTATFPQGPNTFTVYTNNLVTPSGSGDLNTSNDTLVKTVSLVATVTPPIVEGFENPTFPPTGWAVVNSDNGITWARTTAAASSGVASAYVNNYNYNAHGVVDDLYTPVLSYTGVDSVQLRFDVAALTFSYPGSTAVPLDTLEVLITRDCGNTFTSIYKKWGNDLQTINDPSYSQPFQFFPTGKSQWRTETIDLTGLAAGNGPLQVVFRNTTNFENNIFIDNVNLSTRTLPARLKNEGFLVLPSPFRTQFTVWHYLPPTDLRYISVYNSLGQLVWSKSFNGDADKQVMIDLSTRSAGVYYVHLGYTDINKNTSIKIVKY